MKLLSTLMMKGKSIIQKEGILLTIAEKAVEILKQGGVKSDRVIIGFYNFFILFFF